MSARASSDQVANKHTVNTGWAMLEPLEPRLLLSGTTFGPPNDLSLSPAGACSVYVSDLDGDGDVDVLSASWDDNKIAWYERTLEVAVFRPSR